MERILLQCFNDPSLYANLSGALLERDANFYLGQTKWYWLSVVIAADCPGDTFFWLLVGVCLTVPPRVVFIRYPQPEHVLLITTTLQTDFTAAPPGILQ